MANLNQRIILWLRNDLRLHDHEPLLAAIKHAGGNVIPIYCFDPRHFRTTKYGFRKTGPLRARFILECVADLRESLRKLGMSVIPFVGCKEKTVQAELKRAKLPHNYDVRLQEVRRSLNHLEVATLGDVSDQRGR